MPIQLPLKVVTQELVEAHAGIEQARKMARYAKEDAQSAEQQSDLPPEVVEAYRVIAEESEAEITAAERAYELARDAFMAARRQ